MVRKRGLIYGTGVVDVDYPCQVFEVVDGKRKLVWLCPYYETWKQMLRRVYSEKLHVKFPTYKGCKVCEDWLSLCKFKAWMVEQQWELNGKKLQLDKDFIEPNNKLYCPEFCAFVTHNVNSFNKEKPSFAEDLPIGVYRDSAYPDKLAVTCSDPLKRHSKHVGYFTDEIIAHEAWRKTKHRYAKDLADSFYVTDERIAIALRLKYSYNNWYNI